MVFDKHLMRRGLWSSHFQNMNVCDFCLWQNFEHKVYRNNSHTWRLYRSKSGMLFKESQKMIISVRY